MVRVANVAYFGVLALNKDSGSLVSEGTNPCSAVRTMYSTNSLRSRETFAVRATVDGPVKPFEATNAL